MKKRLLIAVAGAAGASGIIYTTNLKVQAAAETAAPQGKSAPTSTTYTGIVKAIDSSLKNLEITTSDNTIVVINVGPETADKISSVKIGDAVSVTGFAESTHFAGDPTYVHAQKITDNGTVVYDQEQRTETTLSNGTVTLLSDDGSAIRIAADGKQYDVQLGKSFLAKHPLKVGDTVSLTGYAFTSPFDLPGRFMPKNITINGTSYTIGHAGQGKGERSGRGGMMGRPD